MCRESEIESIPKKREGSVGQKGVRRETLLRDIIITFGRETLVVQYFDFRTGKQLKRLYPVAGINAYREMETIEALMSFRH